MLPHSASMMLQHDDMAILLAICAVTDSQWPKTYIVAPRIAGGIRDDVTSADRTSRQLILNPPRVMPASRYVTQSSIGR